MMGYGPEDKNAVLELTYNYGVTDYDKGNAYAQVEIISFLCFLLKHVRQNVPHLGACKIFMYAMCLVF